jgi:hypothetical protein
MAFPFSEYLNFGKAGWAIVAYIWRWLGGNKRKLTPQQKLELRAKWKPQVEAWLASPSPWSYQRTSDLRNRSTGRVP